jgi:hypothetical protein
MSIKGWVIKHKQRDYIQYNNINSGRRVEIVLGKSKISGEKRWNVDIQGSSALNQFKTKSEAIKFAKRHMGRYPDA